MIASSPASARGMRITAAPRRGELRQAPPRGGGARRASARHPARAGCPRTAADQLPVYAGGGTEYRHARSLASTTATSTGPSPSRPEGRDASGHAVGVCGRQFGVRVRRGSVPAVGPSMARSCGRRRGRRSRPTSQLGGCPRRVASRILPAPASSIPAAIVAGMPSPIPPGPFRTSRHKSRASGPARTRSPGTTGLG